MAEEAAEPAPHTPDPYDIEPTAPVESASTGGAETPVDDAIASPESKTPQRDSSTGRFVKSEALVQEARELDVAPVEIESLSPEDLKTLVIHLGGKARREALKRASEAAASQSLSQAVEKPIPSGDLGLTPEEEEEIHPPILKASKTIKTALEAKIAALEARLSKFEQAEARRENQTATERVDGVFAKYEDIFGKGKHSDLKPNSVDMTRRLAIVNLVRADSSSASIEDKMAKAIETLYGSVKPSSASEADPLEARKKDWAEGAVQRPTNRVTKEPSGVEKATRGVESALKEMGAGAKPNGVPDSEDFL